MVQVSVVIVNYNVKHLLQLCLYSVERASQNLSVEIIVVDNTSTDGSSQMVRELFPNVVLIENSENVGFGRANNQAISIAQGEYVLILNPDTIIGETTLDECYAFMRNTADAGAIGVHMTDGGGNFLRESKRALPTPMVSFFKVFGLSSLFSQSKLFAQYHLGYLDKDAIHKVDVLSGAFMFMPANLLKRIGMFDEAFFMYGEDIDLSYRVLLAGYFNYYLGTTRIIHFKGESTKKGSLNYVLVFYKAMEIFARKHFTGNGFTPYRLMIESAIWFRAFFSVLKRVFGVFVKPVNWLVHNLRRNISDSELNFKTLFIGSQGSYAQYLQTVGPNRVIVPKLPEETGDDYKYLNKLIKDNKFNDVILCLSSLQCKQAIEITERLSGYKCHIRFLVPNTNAAIGSSQLS